MFIPHKIAFSMCLPLLFIYINYRNILCDLSGSNLYFGILSWLRKFQKKFKLQKQFETNFNVAWGFIFIDVNVQKMN